MADSNGSRVTHGQSYSRVYNIWAMMRQRCNNPNAANYAQYGGRGVKCCPQWAQFSRFYSDMGDPPSSRHTLDRINNDGDYTPENCRWGSVEEQQNNRRNSRKITAFGQTLSVAQWARKTGLSRDQIQHRVLVMGMAPEEALQAARMSWTQRHVRAVSADGSETRSFDSIAAAARALGLRRESLWAHLKFRSEREYAGYFWGYDGPPK